MTPSKLAGYIDHTLLKPEVTEDQIEQLCAEAKEHNFASVCVNPHWVSFCAEQLQGAQAKVCTVIGFPLGASASEVKATEAKTAVKQGATEVDMVINIGELKDGNEGVVQKDIEGVVQAVDGKAIVKVIIETSLLTDEEKEKACQLSHKAGAHFVKTSTGFSGGGATVEDVRLMRQTVGEGMGVKASGGIRDRETAEAMIEAGATRLGASAGVKIIAGEEGTSEY